MNPNAARHRTHGYYPAHDSADEGDLNYHYDRPSQKIPGHFTVEHLPGIRCRIIIEGRVEYVARLEKAMAAELDTIKRELEP